MQYRRIGKVYAYLTTWCVLEVYTRMWCCIFWARSHGPLGTSSSSSSSSVAVDWGFLCQLEIESLGVKNLLSPRLRQIIWGDGTYRVSAAAPALIPGQPRVDVKRWALQAKAVSFGWTDKLAVELTRRYTWREVSLLVTSFVEQLRRSVLPVMASESAIVDGEMGNGQAAWPFQVDGSCLGTELGILYNC